MSAALPPDSGPRLARLARWLLLAAVGTGLLVAWMLSQVYWPARPAAPAALATEATEGPPPPGSYHRPAFPAPD